MKEIIPLSLVLRQCPSIIHVGLGGILKDISSIIGQIWSVISSAIPIGGTHLTHFLEGPFPVLPLFLLFLYLLTTVVVGILVHRWREGVRRATDQRLSSLDDQVERLSHISDTLMKLLDVADTRTFRDDDRYEAARTLLKEGMDAVDVAKSLGLGLGEVRLVSRLMESNLDSRAKERGSVA